MQIWDPVNGHDGTEVGSGGLYNNQKHASKPITRLDKPAGEWNSFRIRMIGEIVTVWLNGGLVVDDVPMENYWDRSRPIFAREQIELQTHGGEIRFRNLMIREIPGDEANAWLRSREASRFTPLTNGMDLSGWTGSTDGYYVENGAIVCDPAKGGNLFSEKAYGDFIARFEFLLPPGGNNGFAIRSPRDATNPAYDGMELQVLDNTHPKYANLKPYQFHGSVYGIVPAHRGYQRAVGEWNFEEVEVRGSRVIVRLNGFTIVDADLAEIETPLDGQAHPGMRRTTGHFVFMGHGDPVRFRNVSVRELD
ncbi:MAG: DUF1080 domain-containing protein [Phycisphaerales bacterium]|nr:DUF1080 domain-containing protein [Phycisphaerales bacterium]